MQNKILAEPNRILNCDWSLRLTVSFLEKTLVAVRITIACRRPIGFEIGFIVVLLKAR